MTESDDLAGRLRQLEDERDIARSPRTDPRSTPETQKLRRSCGRLTAFTTSTVGACKAAPMSMPW